MFWSSMEVSRVKLNFAAVEVRVYGASTARLEVVSCKLVYVRSWKHTLSEYLNVCKYWTFCP